jgi:serine/threonine-protein kinase
MRIGRILFIIVLFFCFFEMTRLWSIMPDPMAAHFNIAGNADRFAPKAEAFRFQLQTLLIVTLVSLPVQALFLVLPPEIVNMPNRAYWLAPERRKETMGRLSDFGSLMFAVILLTVQAAFELSAYANLQTPIVFNARLMGIIMAVGCAIIVLMLVRLIVSFRVEA